MIDRSVESHQTMPLMFHDKSVDINVGKQIQDEVTAQQVPATPEAMDAAQKEFDAGDTHGSPLAHEVRQTPSDEIPTVKSELEAAADEAVGTPLEADAAEALALVAEPATATELESTAATADAAVVMTSGASSSEGDSVLPSEV